MSVNCEVSQPPPKNCCPFCNGTFLRVGNHLPHCPQRNGRDYAMYLSQKTLMNRAGSSKKKQCPNCGKLFIRLDTHLKNSAICKNNFQPQAAQTSQAQTQTACNQEPSLHFHTSIQTDSLPLPAFTMPPPFKTPKTAEEWKDDDSQLAETVVPAVLEAEDIDEKNKILGEGIYNHFASKYGLLDKRRFTSQPRPRNHNRPLKKLRKERNEARKELRKARKEKQDERVILDLAKKFQLLLRLHSKTKKASLKTRVNLEAKKARSECAKSFWKFAAKILDDEHSNNVGPAFTSQTAETFFKDIYSSNPRTFQRPDWLPEPPPPTSEFNDIPIANEEISVVIKHTKTSSSPSPIDQVSYQVLKRCPSLLPALSSLYNACWESASIPSTWKQGVIRLIPKEAAKTNPQEPGNFRPIALTSCIGKVFTSILKNR